MVSLRGDAASATASFLRLYPKEARRAILDIVAAYGIRCVLNEVALEQLSLARLGEVAEKPIEELRSKRLLRPASRGPSAARRRAEARPAPRAEHHERHDAMRQWPFVDGAAGGVAAALAGGHARSPRRFDDACAAEQARRARTVFAGLRSAPDKLARDTLPTALEEVCGRALPPREVAAIAGGARGDVCLLAFLRMVRSIARKDYDVPERGWDDEIPAPRPTSEADADPWTFRSAAGPPPAPPAAEDSVPAPWPTRDPLPRERAAPPAPRRRDPPPQSFSRVESCAPMTAPTASSAARQRPPAARERPRAKAPWFAAAARGAPALSRTVGGGGGGAYAAHGLPAEKKVPRYLAKAESKIKDQLDAHRARLRADKAASQRAANEAVAASALRTSHARPREDADAVLDDLARNRPRAVDIADAFLDSPLVQDWDLLNRDLASKGDAGDVVDDYGIPVDDDGADDGGADSLGDDSYPPGPDGRPDVSAWLGDFGPAHTRSVPDGAEDDAGPSWASPGARSWAANADALVSRSVDDALPAAAEADDLGVEGLDEYLQEESVVEEAEL